MKINHNQLQFELFKKKSGENPKLKQLMKFPATRYLGSKKKMLKILHDIFFRLEFLSALDPFCGTGCVAYLLKSMNKEVTASDILKSNCITAKALVENNNEVLGSDIDVICKNTLKEICEKNYKPGFVENTFENIFYEKMENRFIDSFLHKIENLTSYGKDLCLNALFQACLAKRPYNLFHRANLYMRQNNVRRSFGNKATWDTSFDKLIRRFAKQADMAVFKTEKTCVALSDDVMKIDPDGFDLVYLDPPYISLKGSGVDYLDYYHFLEGLADPQNWPGKILEKYKHKPLDGRGESLWCKKNEIKKVFEKAIYRFSRSTLVVSYRSDGIPSVPEITSWMKRVKKHVEIIDAGKYIYALSQNKKSREVVLVGKGTL